MIPFPGSFHLPAGFPYPLPLPIFFFFFIDIVAGRWKKRRRGRGNEDRGWGRGYKKKFPSTLALQIGETSPPLAARPSVHRSPPKASGGARDTHKEGCGESLHIRLSTASGSASSALELKEEGRAGRGAPMD